MYDGIKSQDLSVSPDLLLTNDRLTFAQRVDGQTGEILDRLQYAHDRGLSFTLIPRQSGGYRVEVKGSLHKFFNEYQNRNTLGNSNDFTADDLLTTIDLLVNSYGINPFKSLINNLEFGVNVSLPFPVRQVLKNLVSYKNRPFTLDTRSDTPYYQCVTQRYVVKLYDKGHQYGLDAHILRVEVKVLKMAYLTRQGVQIRALADLLTIGNYRRLGALLVDTFNEILFDEPTLQTAKLTHREQTIYLNGRNPKYWSMPDDLTPSQQSTHRQRLHRAERIYRALIDKYREGANWQTQTGTIISQTWEKLTTVDDDLLIRMNERRVAWQNLIKPHLLNVPTIPVYCDTTVTESEKCHKLTDPQKPEMSQINPLYLELKCDNDFTPATTSPGAATCLVTGVPIPSTPKAGRSGRKFVSAKMLRNNDELLMKLIVQFKQSAKGSKEDDCSRVSHNVRNTDSNPRNNLKRSIERIYKHPTLFDVSDTLRLNEDQRRMVDYWRGTKWELPI